MTQPSIRIAFPKKGRLKEEFSRTLEDSALKIYSPQPRQDFGLGSYSAGQENQQGFEYVLQRPADALANMADGLVDMAVVGLDSFLEFNNAAQANGAAPVGEIVAVMDFSHCGLFIASPQSSHLTNADDLRGKTVVTSYPNILKKWLESNEVNDVNILFRDGGVEDYVRLGCADAICDVVETGGTLKANGLKKDFSILNSSAVLVQKTGNWGEQQKKAAQTIAENLITGAAVQKPEEQETKPPVQQPAPAISEASLLYA